MFISRQAIAALLYNELTWYYHGRLTQHVRHLKQGCGGGELDEVIVALIRGYVPRFKIVYLLPYVLSPSRSWSSSFGAGWIVLRSPHLSQRPTKYISHQGSSSLQQLISHPFQEKNISPLLAEQLRRQLFKLLPKNIPHVPPARCPTDVQRPIVIRFQLRSSLVTPGIEEMRSHNDLQNPKVVADTKIFRSQRSSIKYSASIES